MEETDVQLHLKKRARRRLVGAMAFVALVAIVLPMIMDHEPKPVVQDVEIRIPGQDEKPFAPRFAAPPPEAPAARSAEVPLPESPPEKLPEPVPAPAPVARSVEKSPDRGADLVPKKSPEKPLAEKFPTEKAPARAEKPLPEKNSDKPLVREPADGEARRAAAILAGKAVEAPARGGEHVILIGAFANEGNVRNLKDKLGELGIRTYMEPLDSPQGRKTRVRAGPFPNREAAEKALERMRRIGVSGVVAAKP